MNEVTLGAFPKQRFLLSSVRSEEVHVEAEKVFQIIPKLKEPETEGFSQGDEDIHVA